MTPPPLDLQLIGSEIALRWPDGVEDFLSAEFLRARSPSAENIGERDIFGQQYGGDGPKNFPGIEILGWKPVGNYGVSFQFSDGHQTGIFTWKFLRHLGGELRGETDKS
jgi:DUF971 family protein